MPRRKYIVKLTEEERGELHKLVTSGRSSARTLTRARILLKTDSGDNDDTVAPALDVALADRRTGAPAVR